MHGKRKFKRSPRSQDPPSIERSAVQIEEVRAQPNPGRRSIIPVKRLRRPIVGAFWAAALFFVVFIAHSSSAVSTSFDSRWTIPTALSLLDHGDTNLDEYPALIEIDHDYSLECVTIDRTIVRGGLCPGGHYYGLYPVAVPILAAPVVWVLREAPTPVREWLALTMIPYERPFFLAKDFIRIHGKIEILVASFFVALTTVVIFLIGRLHLPDPHSVFLALCFAFATSAWSTASRALWQHGPSMLMLSIALYLLLRADEKPRLAAVAAAPVAFAYLLRPTNSLFAIATTIYIATRYRHYLKSYLLGVVTIGAAFVIYNESVYGRVLPSYFSHPSASAGPLPALPGDLSKVLVALAGVMVSPSRGLLIYSPIFLFSIWGMIRALRTRWRAPLSAYLTAVIIANWFLLGAYFQNWLGGHSYGPRLFSDLTPFFIFFLIPALLKLREATKWSPLWAVGLLALFGASAFIHSRGARSYDVWGWNSTPANDMARVWDWRDAQFLRGLQFPKSQK